jgi:hypothetical protein
MTVKELIDYLSQENPDMEVVVNGYEDGFDPIKTPFKKSVNEVPDAAWYNGLYDETSYDMMGKIVLVLPR